MADFIVQDYVLDVSFAQETFTNYRSVCPSADDEWTWHEFLELAKAHQLTLEQYNAFFAQDPKPREGVCRNGARTIAVITPVDKITSRFIDAEDVSRFDRDTQVYLRNWDGSPASGREPVPYAVMTNREVSDITYGEDGLFHQQFKFSVKFNNPDQLFFPFSKFYRTTYDQFVPLLVEDDLEYYQNSFDYLQIEYTLEQVHEKPDGYDLSYGGMWKWMRDKVGF